MQSGVYTIRNIRNSKQYIGSSTHISTRWRAHKRQLEKNCHHSLVLQRAWNKYGSDSFVFQVLAYCDPGDCLFFEQRFFDIQRPEYNISPTAGSPLGVKHTCEARDNMSKAHQGIFDGDKNPFYGKQHSSVTKQKISTSRKGKTAGEKHPRVKLKIKDVKRIRSLVHGGVAQDSIARQFDVAQTTISAIKNRKIWSHV